MNSTLPPNGTGRIRVDGGGSLGDQLVTDIVLGGGDFINFP
jgi:hypothetical protein